MLSRLSHCQQLQTALYPEKLLLSYKLLKPTLFTTVVGLFITNCIAWKIVLKNLEQIDGCVIIKQDRVTENLLFPDVRAEHGFKQKMFEHSWEEF